MKNNILFFESHYEVPSSEILPYARNVSSNSMVDVLNIILEKIGFSKDDYEIRLVIPEKGSYKDTIKIILKGFVDSATIGTFILLLYNQFYPNEFDITNKKLQLIDIARKLGVDCDDADYQNIMKDVCKDVGIKRALSKKYKALDKDKNLKSENLIMKKDKEVVFNTKIQRSEFSNFEYLVEEKNFSEIFNNITIELISPVLLNSSKRLWVGIYNGNTIKSENIPILLDGDTISFSMEDNDFKKRIQNKEISFSQGDYVYANLEISGIFNYDDNVLTRRKIKALSIYKATDGQKKEIKDNFVNKEIQKTPLFDYGNKSNKKNETK